MKTKIIILLLLVAQTVLGLSIIGSKHDLSITNFYGPMGGATTQVCVFCHTPHAASTEIKGPIWNRGITNMNAFTMYDGTAGTPNNSTMVCLSCHDGISGEGDESAVYSFQTHSLVNNPGPKHGAGISANCFACHNAGPIYPGKEWRIGPNLTDDHPVSVLYRPDLPSEFLAAPTNGVKLYDGMVECASCHDVHDNQYGMFLRTFNDNSSQLCHSCHIK